MPRKQYASLYERLVANTVEHCGCWLWTGRIRSKRPALNIRVDGKHVTVNAARAMLNIEYVMTPEIEASHLCEISYLCIRPDHLLPETKKQNMARRWGRPVPAGVPVVRRNADDVMTITVGDECPF